MTLREKLIKGAIDLGHSREDAENLADAYLEANKKLVDYVEITEYRD